MASDAYGVKLDGELDDRYTEYLEEHQQMSQSEAHRRVLDEGLRSMGYTPAYREASERFLALIRGVASVFAIVALILIGVNSVVNVGLQFRLYGFGMAVMSLGAFAAVEVADRHGKAMYDWIKKQLRNEAKQWTGKGAS